MHNNSANLNIMIKAARKASKSLIRDFNEIEKLSLYYALSNATKRRYHIKQVPYYSFFAIIYSIFVRIIHIPRMFKLKYFKGKGKQNYT